MAGKNIVVCADGTGNTFHNSVSNITRMIRLLDLRDRKAQVAVYDQGLGTNAARLASVERFCRSVPDPGALHILPGPRPLRLDPRGFFARLLGLGFGYGLKANVGEMWMRLGGLYHPGDRIFLFGFSRGAFEARALAGLIYRCGLPGHGHAGRQSLFDAAWRLFRPWEPDRPALAAFRRANPEMRDCRIHFLGLYDTVKSYGGVWPAVLPHLRHNPIVDTVRHALAMDERRAWFDATTWGGLDSDRSGAATRLSGAERAGIAKQSIREVWFRGCHSDIGGGDREAATAHIALRWMLGESLEAGLMLNPDELVILCEKDPPGIPEIHESFTWPWRLVECLPRGEIDNSRPKSRRKPAMFWNGRRDPLRHTRDGKVLVHATARLHGLDPDRVEIQSTRDLDIESLLPGTLP